ncbi:MAG: FRG domain-containing protein [Anaerolineales bacterium]|jgi:hypothetical protein
MEEINLTNWDEFSYNIKKIRSDYGIQQSEFDGRTRDEKNRILFRGQSNSEWPLQTTLERQTTERFHVEKYLSYAASCAHEIEAYTGYKWGINDNPTISREIQEKQIDKKPYLPHYDYLIYLRQHSFPSPLLDWTESPYIAAFFALSEQKDNEKSVVYAYIENITDIRDVSRNTLISVLGLYVSTHKRHFSQKSWYTIATKWDEISKRHYFCSHDEIFSQPVKDQDVLVKITFPFSQRGKGLVELNDYNINYFTLFQTEEYLIKALAMKIFVIDKS